MKLRTKLFLGIALIFVMMVVMIYVVPAFFFRSDINEAAAEIHDLLVDEQRALNKSQESWVEHTLKRNIQNINSILLMLADNSQRIKELSGRSMLSVWELAARISGFDPDIGFIQIRLSNNQVVVVSPQAADLFHIEKIGVYKDVTIFRSSEAKTDVYAGIPLPDSMQKDEAQALYALIDLQQIGQQKELLDQEFSDLATDPFVSLPSHTWALKIDLIGQIAPLVFEGFAIKGSTFTPKGIAQIDPSGNGVALLSDEAFHTAPFFDEQGYIELHPPKEGKAPLAQGSIFVVQGEEAYIANTLLVGDTFVSIGFPLSDMIKELALSANKTILLHVNEQLWLGYDSSGEKISSNWIEEVLKTGLQRQKKGILTVDKQPFFYARLTPLNSKNFVLYEMHPLEGMNSIFHTLSQLENKLIERISWQLSLMALITLAVVVLLIWRMGFSIVKPITRLAEATEEIVEGRYDEVVLPDTGHRQDEVATLVHAFDEMVNGLRERERIRGVLDKVVSKDVAEEILRTQIHLGGEDRIVTMLFSDIRDFSEITENLTPQKTIEMLNGCMTKISRVIEGEGGVIDKYVGDEVMAIFGAPAIHPDHALRAVSSGMLIIETLKRWNHERKLAGEPTMEMGIGIHTGLVVAGNMGAEDRLNYTVLGANVNLASRLCQVALPNQLIISEATLSEPNIEESFFVKPLKKIVLKGFKEPVSVYEVVGFKWEDT